MLCWSLARLIRFYPQQDSIARFLSLGRSKQVTAAQPDCSSLPENPGHLQSTNQRAAIRAVILLRAFYACPSSPVFVIAVHGWTYQGRDSGSPSPVEKVPT